MSNTPKWHGWATPEQVRQMFVEMWEWLIKHNEDGDLRLTYEGYGNDWTKKDNQKCPCMTASAANVELAETYGLKSPSDIQFVRIVDGKWSD